MGLYSAALPCGCEHSSCTLDYPPTAWISHRCPEHTPRQGEVITYDFSTFIRQYGEATHRQPLKLAAYVVEPPTTKTIDDSTYRTIRLRVRFPPDIKLADKAYELRPDGQCRVVEHPFGDCEVVATYIEGAVTYLRRP